MDRVIEQVSERFEKDKSSDVPGRVALVETLEDVILEMHEQTFETNIQSENRIEEFLLAEVLKAHRLDLDIAKCQLIIIDIDDLDYVNAVYGRGIGDKVIDEVAKRIKTHRTDQLLSLIVTGDSFIVLSDNRQPELWREELRQKVSGGDDLLILFQERKPVNLPISASMGFAVLGIDGSSENELLQIASERLREEKMRKKHSKP